VLMLLPLASFPFECSQSTECLAFAIR
jgi:hypothetical protein